MKKFLSCILTIVLLFFIFSIPVSAQKPVQVFVNEVEITFDVPPQLIQGRTMVPLRPVFEALQTTVTWNDATKTVTATKDERIVSLSIGQPTMFVDGEPIELDVAPIIIDNRTLIPVRFVAEAFDCVVTWDSLTRVVNITSAYPGSTVPTYTGVTGIPLKETRVLSNGQTVYIYNYSRSDYLGDYYTRLYETEWTPYLDFTPATDNLPDDYFPTVHIENAVILSIRSTLHELWIGF